MSSLVNAGPQRKRKLEAAFSTAAPKRPRGSGSSTLTRPKKTSKGSKKKDESEQESISGSDSDESGSSDAGEDYGDDDDEQKSDEEGLTAAECRLKLAERYLENVKKSVDESYVGFDAEDIDRDLIAERLQDDVAETKGQMYRRILDDYDFPHAIGTQFRCDNDCTTSIAVCPPYAFTVSIDRCITKWELAAPQAPDSSAASALPNTKKMQKSPRPQPRRPKKVQQTRGNRTRVKDKTYKHHVDHILCAAASADGKFLVTGGADKRLIVWDQATLKPLHIFNKHRDAVTSVVFRRGTNQLYSCSSDRTIKTWSLDEFAYIETLYGHQDSAVDVAALGQERCISAGARDMTVRLWKVVEETQLVFRGGRGLNSENSKSRKTLKGSSEVDKEPAFAAGSIDCVAMIDDSTFLSGADDGSISLWSVQKKKPVFVVPEAHGRDPPPNKGEWLAEANPEGITATLPPAEPRWITALATIPYSDLVLSGSWDGQIRVWRVSADKKRLDAFGCLSRPFAQSKLASDLVNRDAGLHKEAADDESKNMEKREKETKEQKPVACGMVNDIAVFERGECGQEGLCVIVALGKHHRLGKWRTIPEGKNGAMVFEIPPLKKSRGVLELSL